MRGILGKTLSIPKKILEGVADLLPGGDSDSDEEGESDFGIDSCRSRGGRVVVRDGREVCVFKKGQPQLEEYKLDPAATRFMGEPDEQPRSTFY